LLAPPFNKTKNNPGYIKNYYPGMRENGGQYTHAAIWLAMAKTMLKDREGASDLFSMLNPIITTSNKKDAMRYEKEPYVMIADISMADSKEGKGGWSWYTGSASWMYQALINSFLGLKRSGQQLIIDSATPPSFGDYKVEYRFGSSLYLIKVKGSLQQEGYKTVITLDGEKLFDNKFNLKDDNRTHHVEVTYSPF
jgi:cellobiose phosphorylase